MPAKRTKQKVEGVFFTWLLGQRNGVYFADGRSNRVDLGRHSLGTRNLRDAHERLKSLDRVKAVENGLADKAILVDLESSLLTLEDGRSLYETYIQRPRVVGGAKPVSAKRYRAVFDKFETFAKQEGFRTWNEVNHTVLEKYAAYLDDDGYAYATEYLELTTLKQAVKWLISEGKLPGSHAIRLPLRKPQGTTTYSWTPAEVQAMVNHCFSNEELHYLGEIIVALACTGLRISELASLRWTDVDFHRKRISLTDESRHGRNLGAERRETKSGRSRSFPINEDFLKILSARTRAKDGLVFHGVLGGRLKADTVRNALIRDVLDPISKDAQAINNVADFRRGRLHSFRHYFCSACANQGVPEQVVKEWLGHADSKMVRHYYHLHDEEAQRQMGRVSFVRSIHGNVATDESLDDIADSQAKLNCGNVEINGGTV